MIVTLQLGTCLEKIQVIEKKQETTEQSDCHLKEALGGAIYSEYSTSTIHLQTYPYIQFSICNGIINY